MYSRAYAQSLLESGRLDLLAQEFADLEGGSRVDSSRATEYLEFLWRSRRYPDLEGVIHGILSDPLSDPILNARARLYQAKLGISRAEYASVLEMLSPTLEDATQANLPIDLRADLYGRVGRCWYRLRNFRSATACLKRSVALAESCAWSEGVADGLQLLSLVAKAQVDWNLAESLQRSGLQIYLGLSDIRRAAGALLNLVTLRMFRAAFVTAELALARATALADESGDGGRIARPARLGALLAARQKGKGSRRCFVHALGATLSTSDPRGRALLCEYTGEFRLAGGYLSRARRWLQRGYALAYRIPERDIMGETQRLLAEVEFQSKNTNRALELAEESLAAFEKMEDLYELAVCRRVRGGILLHLGRTAEAIHDLERAVDFFTQMGERFEIYRAQRLLALARGEAIDDADTLIATLGRSYDAEGARLRAELEANEVDPIADLLNQPFPADAGRFPAGSRGADHRGTDDQGADGNASADTRDPAANTDPTRVSPNPTWPLTREQIEESISLARLRTIQVLRTATNPGFPELHGKSPLLRAALQQVREAAPTDQPILIQGETGTGKELVARAVHDLSRRARGPYVPVNCGALSPEMLDSEVFGHQKGAFTGAITERAGLARTASGGTLFLDEIAELGSGSQPRLLRMLDSGEIRPVGADRAIKVDVRLVTATHKDLRQAVEANEFRRDLYHRLCGLTIYLPALRDRIDDLPILIEHFAQQLRERGIEFVGVSDAVLTSMSEYDWPGNVRELRNQLFALASRALPGRRVTQWSAPVDPRQAIATALELTESQIDAALRLHQGRVLPAAATLGISKQALYRLCERYGIVY